ncbi:unnamed protein product [Choristocarpus tenellus]
MGMCVITPPSEVAVISGPKSSRMIIGQCTFAWWFIERVEVLSLELITLKVHSTEAETVRGVRVNVTGTCQVKVNAFTPDDPEPNIPSITLACQHFLGKSKRDIQEALLLTMEGHQRQILGTLTVEELYKVVNRLQSSKFRFVSSILVHVTLKCFRNYHHYHHHPHQSPVPCHP